MASGFEDQAKISALPQEGVHCFPANAKQINSRRVITAILFVLFAMAAIYGFMKMGMLIILACVGVLGAIISVLVFAQTFLIAKYRVAVDYNEKNIVLRFRYSNIKIPFESFDARDGAPDRAEALVDGNFSNERAMYLVLDNVFEDACFQTSTRDLASKEDFLKLKEEAFAIADAYGARNSEDKVRFWNESEKKSDLDDDDIAAIVEDARNSVGDPDPAVIPETVEEAETAEKTVETSETSDAEEKAEETESSEETPEKGNKEE
ncbi:MAG: hypothetical protein K6A80_01160 [Saccharofermentans sp.]|nr:hypothetical protein [Saccharofermentans sp.]